MPNLTPAAKKDRMRTALCGLVESYEIEGKTALARAVVTVSRQLEKNPDLLVGLHDLLTEAK